MTKTIDDLKPGDRVRFEHEDGNAIVGEVIEAVSRPVLRIRTLLASYPPVTWFADHGFTLAHVEPATPPLPEEPPVGSVVRWKDAPVPRIAERTVRRDLPWSASGGVCYNWAELCEHGAPELLVSRAELVSEIADWAMERSGNNARAATAKAIRERFLP